MKTGATSVRQKFPSALFAPDRQTWTRLFSGMCGFTRATSANRTSHYVKTSPKGLVRVRIFLPRHRTCPHVSPSFVEHFLRRGAQGRRDAQECRASSRLARTTAPSSRALPVGTDSRQRTAAAEITTPRHCGGSLAGPGPQLPCQQASRDRAVRGWDWHRCRSLEHQAALAGGIQSQISGGDAGW